MNENQLKALHGLETKTELIDALKYIQANNDSVSECSSQYRCGYGSNNSQFYCPFVIEMTNGDKYLIFSTNSIRSDRLCIQQWNADNIKKIDDKVVKAIVVLPNDVKSNLKEFKSAESYKNTIKSGDYYSAIDLVVYQDELLEMFNNK